MSRMTEVRGEALSIFILIDALGWTYIKDVGFLSRESLVRAPVKSILGFSSAAIPSILTGKMPAEHGHWSLFSHDPGSSPFRWSRFLPFLSVAPERAARKVIEEVSMRLHRYSGYFETYLIPLDRLRYYDICERKDIYRPGGITPSASIFDLWERAGIDCRVLTYRHGDDAKLFSLASGAVEEDGLRALFIYLSGMDAFLHERCRDERAFRERLSFYEEKVRGLIEAAGRRYKEVRWFVFSDHGMAPTKAVFDLMAEVEKTGLQEGETGGYRAFYDSTMARFWFFDERARKAITARLAQLKCGRWLGEKEKDSLGISFPDDRYGEGIFLMEPGVVIAPSYMGDKAPGGMHGFHPDDEHSDGVYLSNVAGRPAPERITGLFNLMKEETLGPWQQTTG